ncbi:methylmalonyl-CoA mutase subunit beta [Snuella sedimenti]|uniref:Methylmalonyl-CoA mutase subunit beta n=1 Tax=Snuella sedimenti TaxID=2798802 RepID=A0A8J7LM19_9FLAO|nr:methylmalonyl-CoA mutase subunit beta [Snuella sedimenti]MBJ6366984.1 methylmalonyl-CoA mutase subunit beta [Snuella sedimenti]
MTKLLFKEFNPVSSKQWKQKIQFDLDGADYNSTLVWESNEGIAVKPFYHADDLHDLPKVSSTKATQWLVCQSIFVANTSASNLKAVNAIKDGVESIKFIVPSKEIAIKELLKDINLDTTRIYLQLQFLSEAYIKTIHAIPAKAGIYILTDSIGHLARNGNWFYNLNKDFELFTNYFLNNISKSQTYITVDTTLYQNAGANIVQQLAYALAHANEYLNQLDSKAKKALRSTAMLFNVSIGSNYFFEIAKLRALRLLWKTLAREYSIVSDCHIIAYPTKRNKTLYDSNTNMLRTTTESMSAILGGANTICNLPYDTIYRKDNIFSERIARNQLLILKHESYFDKVNNPPDGAYYIETITRQLAEKALDLFKEIEANGGFLKQLKSGTIQRKIKESAAKEQQLFDAGEEILLGTNKHPNKQDKVKETLELYPFVKIHRRKTLIEPIIEKRLAEKLEQERLKKEH